MMKKTNGQKQAWGLVEILIALGIFGAAIVSITALNARSYAKIRENEKVDLTNRIMVSASEYFKSPVQDIQDLLLNNLNPTGETYFVLDSTNNSNIISAEQSGWTWKKSNYRLTVDTCNNSSDARAYFKSTETNVPDQFLFCLQVGVVKKNNGFQITSTTVYKESSTMNSNLIIGYRPFTYEY